MSTLVTKAVGLLSGHISKKAIVFLISMVPLLELRGGILAASPALLDVPPLSAISLCILGNLIPIPFILLFISRLLLWMENTRLLGGLAGYLRKKADKNKASIERLGIPGLILFVGIPLPGTGAWTGAMVASLLRLDFKKSFLAITAGVFIASAIMTVISYGLLASLAA